MTGEDIDSKAAIYPWGPPMEEESVKVDFLSSIPVGQSSKKGDIVFVYDAREYCLKLKMTIAFNHGNGSLLVNEEYLNTYVY